ncbi:MAG: hypothetical protein ABI689_15980 [Thermoanaerobaculia bacterium]
MRQVRRATPFLLMFSLAALLAGCFEPPVAERLLLEFRSDGAARATLMIDLGRAEDFESPAVRKRIATTERALLEGSDPWLARFEGLTQGTDGTSDQRSRGALREFRRWAELNDPTGFSALFADDPVDFSYSRNAATATLELSPSGASRATRKERQRVESDVAEWSAAFARYVDRVFELERFLAANPERRKSCWQRVFGVKGAGAGESAAEGGAEPAPAEEALAKGVSDGIAELLGAFEIDGREGFSLDERVRKVFHPLSAQLLVTLPAAATEVVGFDSPSAEDQAGEEEYAYAFPERSLLAALDALEGRWLRAGAGPLRAMLDHLRSNPDGEIDIQPFVDGPVTKESTTPPGPTAVADPLLELLRPEGAYRLVWQIPHPESR